MFRPVLHVVTVFALIAQPGLQQNCCCVSRRLDQVRIELPAAPVHSDGDRCPECRRRTAMDLANKQQDCCSVVQVKGSTSGDSTRNTVTRTACSCAATATFLVQEKEGSELKSQEFGPWFDLRLSSMVPSRSASLATTRRFNSERRKPSSTALEKCIELERFLT